MTGFVSEQDEQNIHYAPCADVRWWIETNFNMKSNQTFLFVQAKYKAHRTHHIPSPSNDDDGDDDDDDDDNHYHYDINYDNNYGNNYDNFLQ